MEQADRRELERVPEPSADAATHMAMTGSPRTVRPAMRAPGAEQAPLAEGDPAADATASLIDDPGALDILLGAKARPANAPPVSIDARRAAPMAVAAFHAGVVADCLERAAMLARHRDERPLRERPRAEARLLAQIDAIAAAGASPEDLVRWWEEQGADDPWMIWPVAFALGSFEGRAPLLAAADLLDALPGDAAESACLAAEALVLAPHPHLAALASNVLRSPHPLARATGVDVLSRRGLLDPERALALINDASPRVTAAALRAFARGFGGRDQDSPLPRAVAVLVAHPDPEVCWEAARAITVHRHRDAYLEVRDGGRLAQALCARALEILVWAGELSDLGAMEAIVRRLPASPDVLDAVARFGHAGSWAYLVHYLGDEGLAGAASAALVTVFGPRVPPAEAKLPAAWRNALTAADLSPSVRYRHGVPWSLEGAAAELAGGDLTRRQIEPRLDELRTRGVAGPLDLGAWSLSSAALRAALVGR
jgi:hypothetical protein